MCSGVRLVKMAASKLMNLCRYCLMPSDVVSMSMCVHPACFAWYRNSCSLNLPAIVIWYGFSHSFSFILNISDDDTATFMPASSKILESMKIVLDLPFVPVNTTTTMPSEGNEYHSAARNAKHK